MPDIDFAPIVALLESLPALDRPDGSTAVGKGALPDGGWWVKFSLNVEHTSAWRHVQELGHILNYLSVEERLPTQFFPVSPPPYLNGGVEFLSWIIVCQDPQFTPEDCARALSGRLPDPLDDLRAWQLDD